MSDKLSDQITKEMMKKAIDDGKEIFIIVRDDKRSLHAAAMGVKIEIVKILSESMSMNKNIAEIVNGACLMTEDFNEWKKKQDGK